MMSINWERKFINVIIDYFVFIYIKKGDHMKLGRLKTRI